MRCAQLVLNTMYRLTLTAWGDTTSPAWQTDRRAEYRLDTLRGDPWTPQ